MKLNPISLVITALFLLFAACTPTPKITKIYTAEERLTAEINQLINDPALANAQIGIYIEDLENQNVLYRLNTNKMFTPASNMKLYTTAAALEYLGTNFTFNTEVYYTGEIKDSTLHGDLIIRGLGDPSISGRFNEGEIYAIFEQWADSLTHFGIKNIKGNVLGDAHYFSDPLLGSGWQWDDEPYYYSAQLGALSFNDNCVDITILPGNEVGNPVEISYNGPQDYVVVQNKAITVAADSLRTLKVWRERAQNKIIVSGNLPLYSKKSVKSITIEQPDKWFMANLAYAWSKVGLKWDGKIGLVNKNEHDAHLRTKLFTHHSPNLAEMVKVVNKKSNNFYAEQLLKALGAEIKKVGQAQAGAEAVSDWLRSKGVLDLHAEIHDGSGLSRYNLITPYATATLLRNMYHSPNYKAFLASLPISGIDGTLKYQMRNSPAAERVFAKTGTLTHVRTLSGYLKGKNGQNYLFVTMLNSFSVPVSYAKSFQNRLCVLLTQYSESKK